MGHKIVLDTNCLLASLSSRSANYVIWKRYQEGTYVLCVSNEILEEYAEIIAQKTTVAIANSVVNAIVESAFTEFVDPQFHLHLIKNDPDDNKFVDCAFASNATFIVSNDNHFKILDLVEFPRISVLKIEEFRLLLSNDKK